MRSLSTPSRWPRRSAGKAGSRCSSPSATRWHFNLSGQRSCPCCVGGWIVLTPPGPSQRQSRGSVCAASAATRAAGGWRRGGIPSEGNQDIALRSILGQGSGNDDRIRILHVRKSGPPPLGRLL